jgi:hypothetical protein
VIFAKGESHEQDGETLSPAGQPRNAQSRKAADFSSRIMRVSEKQHLAILPWQSCLR